MDTTNKLKFTIIGSGAMGTAMAKVLFDAGFNNITIYGQDQTELAALASGQNPRHFPTTTKLPNFITTTDLSKALTKSDYVVLAVPSIAMDAVMNDLLKTITTPVKLINVSKGFYPHTAVSLHRGLGDKTANNHLITGIVSLIGPSHAEEIVRQSPTIVAVVGHDQTECAKVQAIFRNNYFKTYIQCDVNGAEVGAAYKNVIAIAAGITAGMGYGVNAQAALLTRGLAEMQRLNKVMGGKAETLLGLTGIGDLIVTATSDLSRNFTFGKEFAKLDQKAFATKKTVEGLYALKVIHQMMTEQKLDLPIVKYLYNILYHGDPKDEVVKKIWSSPARSE